MGSKMAGAILSGGKNKRMGGENKAFIKIKNAPLIEMSLNIFKDIFDEVFLITNDPQSYSKYEKNCYLIEDKIKNIGPLGGIHAGLSHTSKKGVFFIACDMPFLHNEFIKEQIDFFDRLSCEALIPQIGNFVEPLHGIYSKKLKNKIELYLKSCSNYSIKDFLKTIGCHYFKLKDDKLNRKQFVNLNSPFDLGGLTADEGKI